jgi:microcystin-dependent protein
MTKQGVSIIVGSILGATLINAVMMSCGSVQGQQADARVDTPAAALDAPTGTIVAYGGMTAPDGWLLCDGMEISRAGYGTLFSVIGTIYGQGDQVTTFKLPDLRGRAAIGAGQGTGLTTRALAEVGGEEQHVLSVAEMPSHTHREKGSNRLDVANGGGIHVQDVDNTSFAAIDSGATGGGMPHNTMPPFVALNYIIKI